MNVLKVRGTKGAFTTTAQCEKAEKYQNNECRQETSNDIALFKATSLQFEVCVLLKVQQSLKQGHKAHIATNPLLEEI